MKLKWLKEWTTVFCISFTVMVLAVIFIESINRGGVSRDYGNILLCFFWTGIAILTLSLYPLLEKLPFILTIILQYSIAMGVVFLCIWCGGWISEIHPNAYKDAFRSFSLFYGIGAAVFYILEKRNVKKQNEVLAAIKALKKQDK